MLPASGKSAPERIRTTNLLIRSFAIDTVLLCSIKCRYAYRKRRNTEDYKGIIANPNCSTISLTLALAPLHEGFGLQQVFDAQAKPLMRDRVFSPWAEDLRALATLSNVACKLSGLVTEADWHDWQPAQIQPFVDEVDPRIEVVRFDVPGAGGSPAPKVPYNFALLACFLRHDAIPHELLAPPLAELGLDSLTSFELKGKIDGLNAGKMPIWEPGLEALATRGARACEKILHGAGDLGSRRVAGLRRRG